MESYETKHISDNLNLIEDKINNHPVLKNARHAVDMGKKNDTSAQKLIEMYIKIKALMQEPPHK